MATKLEAIQACLKPIDELEFMEVIVDPNLGDIPVRVVNCALLGCTARAQLRSVKSGRVEWEVMGLWLNHDHTMGKTFVEFWFDTSAHYKQALDAIFDYIENN